MNPLYDEYFICGMIHLMKSLKDVQAQGEDLNTVDWDFLIEQRKRDMQCPDILDTVESVENKINEKCK